MKRLKKMMALIIAVAMVMSMTAISAFAADDYTLTINNTVSGHKYTAYQIFKGSKADTSQVQYTKTTTYDADATYYYKNGADYDVIAVANETDFGTKIASQDLYIRTGNSGLGNVVWGDDITTAGKKALYTAYSMTVADANLDDPANIQALVDAVANVTDTTTSESDKAVKFANVFFETSEGGDVTAKAGLLNAPAAKQVKDGNDGSITYTDLASGYYLINDSYTPAEGEVNGIDYSIARIAVQVVGNTTINNKADKTVTKKKVKTAGELLNEKANELGIGRAVNYEVTETVPNYDGYNYYYFNMVDKLSDGLTFDKDSVSVTIAKADGTDSTTLTKLTAPATSANGKGYYLYADKTNDADVLNGNTFVIAFEDIMKFPVGYTITVNYSASVNSDAITGVNPNTNEVKVQYSNSPDKSEKGDKRDYPGIPENTTDHPMGKTPSSYTDTYTTQLTIHKVDKDGNKLENVEFTLTGTSKDVVVKNETVYELDPTGTFYMLNDGTYTETAPREVATLQETTNNSGWVEIVTGDTYSGDDIRTVGGKKYRPFVVETDKDKTRYIIVEGNAADYASTTLRYKETVKSTTADTQDNYKVTRVGKTDSNGDLEFAQLGAGTYTLSETGVLPGFNDIEDISFTITCTLPDAEDVIAGTEEATWAISNITPTTMATGFKQTTEKVGEPGSQTDKNLGIFEVTIENNSGTELPSTGGIGTTIFYVVGTILVIGAGVVLITKRRMDA